MKLHSAVLRTAVCIVLFALSCDRQASQTSTRPSATQFPAAQLGRFYQANGFIEMNQYQQAADLLAELVEATDREPAVLANQAIALMSLQRLDDAEAAIRRAGEQGGERADLSVIRAAILDARSKRDDAVASLRKAVAMDPESVTARYALTQALRNQNDAGLRGEIAESSRVLAQLMPRNVAALLEAAKAHAEAGDDAAAWAFIDRVEALLGDGPTEVTAHLAAARAARITASAPGGSASAPAAPSSRAAAARLFNLLLTTDRFRADRLLLGSSSSDPTWMVVRHPIRPLSGPSAEAIAARVQFEAGTDALGLGAVAKDAAVRDIAWGTVTDDRAPALYVIREGGAGRLLARVKGRFEDQTSTAGLGAAPPARSALFMDVNNDRRMDLVISGAERDALYINDGAGRFADETTERLGDVRASVGAAPFDYDNDGDLDLIRWDAAGWAVHRNDGEGRFRRLDVVRGLPGDIADISAVRALDLDDDGDIDLVVSLGRGPVRIRVFSNERLASFREVTDVMGAERLRFEHDPLLEDFDNNGWFELRAGAGGGGSIEIGVDFKPSPIAPAEGGAAVDSAVALDLDRNGKLDVVTVQQGRTSLAGVTITPGARLLALDLDGDGAVDLLSTRGEAFLNRTEGAGHWLGVALAAVIQGDSRFNAFGIGSSIEIRAGDLYQKRVVTGPTTWFGLGPHREADVMRIIWPNGSYQNISFRAFDAMRLAGDRVIVQEQSLKGSCPYLYAWNGSEFAFVTDVLWRSALGMSIMAEVFGHHGTADDYFKIAGGRLAPRDGKYVLQFTEELWETAYFDYCRLFVVDHPAGTDVFVDEKCMPPPYPPFRIHGVRGARTPRANDERGRDVTGLLAAADDLFVGDFQPTRYQGLVNDHDLILDLGDFDPAQEVMLYLSGWLMPTDASVNVAVSQSATLAARPPSVHLVGPDGNWAVAIPSMGFPSGKNKTVIVDLTGRFATADHRVKISTNFAIYWDRVLCAIGPQDVALTVTELPVASADLHYRGSSHEYRRVAGGPMEPDYDALDPERTWRDLVGWCTRYGDVTALLRAPEGHYVIVNSGDEVTLTFDAAAVPALRDGWVRDYIIHTDGWLKDGDLNSATGKTVEPLPFHGMSAFPYPANEHPADAAGFQEYQREFNTRWIDQGRFRTAVRGTD